MTDSHAIKGVVSPGFEKVRDAFSANFEREGTDAESGAALCVHVRGRCVVDLWGGQTGPEGSPPWQADTLVNIWSATKGVVALAVAVLVDQGHAHYDDPVARYWPEFAQAGKADITLGQVMSHQAGLNGFAAPTTIEEFFDWPSVTARLAAQVPYWPPGTLASYHAMTYGFLAGEVIRRLSGQMPGDFVRTSIAQPLQAEFYIGLPAELEPRVASIIPPPSPIVVGGNPVSDVAGYATINPRVDPMWPRRRDWRAAQVPAANGHASARGLGRIYGAVANGGVLNEVRVISSAGIDRLAHTRHAGPDQMLGGRSWAAGVAKNLPGTFGPDPETFGHTGWGGAFGCANPARGIGIGYVMNRMGPQLTDNPRGTSLCAAIFAAAS